MESNQTDSGILIVSSSATDPASIAQSKNNFDW